MEKISAPPDGLMPDLSTSVQPTRLTARNVSSSEYFFAGCVGLGLMLLTARVVIARDSFLLPLLPLLFYQDLFALVVFAWLFHGLFALAKSGTAHRVASAAAWALIVLWAIYTPITVVIYATIGFPLTSQLLATSEGVHASILQALSFLRLASIPMMALAVLVVAESFRRLAPGVLHQMYRGFYSITGVAFTIVYVVSVHTLVVRYDYYQPVVSNPEWAFLASLFERDRPIVSDIVPAAYMDDFLPAGQRAQLPAVRNTALATAFSHRPLNVIMIVMESVGARRLQLYGAANRDSPELIRLARHGALFKRLYASEAYTSSAMAGLFCSIYNQHSWWTILGQAPTIGVTGIATVLGAHGYRTAFIHSGQMLFDHQGLFIRSHGFSQLISDDRDYDTPRDGEMFSNALNWVKADPSRPFFLTLWTQDTHHPYLQASDRYNIVRRSSLDRYLKAVQSTDALIGQLAHALAEMGLADSTLLVITGDHGEAFGEHGQLIHGFTVYDEEVRVPLLIVNPKLFPHQVVVNSLGSQIDIAPTLLGMLGYPEPSLWQGRSLLTDLPRSRAYLFSAHGNFTLGLVEGDFKYIYNFNRDRAELYDLATDPYERDNLSSDPKYAPFVRRAHLRLEAWISFQNRYIAQLVKPLHPSARP